jgi:hypothetical protein
MRGIPGHAGPRPGGAVSPVLCARVISRFPRPTHLSQPACPSHVSLPPSDSPLSTCSSESCLASPVRLTPLNLRVRVISVCVVSLRARGPPRAVTQCEETGGGTWTGMGLHVYVMWGRWGDRRGRHKQIRNGARVRRAVANNGDKQDFSIFSHFSFSHFWV